MSLVRPDNIRIIAESLGIKVTVDAATGLAPDVEYRLREIIQEGAKFMRHSKRSHLSTQDINNALRLRNVEPLYGLEGPDPVRFLRASGFPDVFFPEDPELSMEQAVSLPLPKPPVEVGVVPHWLAIGGVQPAIPENMPLERSRVKRPKLTRQQQQQQPALAKPVVPPKAAGQGTAEEGAATTGTGGGGTLVRAPVKHVVPQELQLYFDRVARLLRGAQQGDQEPLHRAVLASLGCDPGLQPLAPYLVKLLGEGVGAQLKSLPSLSLNLSAARALATNPHLDLSPYLHQLMPPLLTCLVARRLGAAAGEDHWAVRDQAAAVVAAVCRRYGASYESIAPRVQKTMVKALRDAGKPLTTHYGAIRGLAALGPRVVQLLLLPSLLPYMSLLAPKLTAGAAAGGGAAVAAALGRYEAAMVRGALLEAVAGCVFRHMAADSCSAAPAQRPVGPLGWAGLGCSEASNGPTRTAGVQSGGQHAKLGRSSGAGAVLSKHRGRLALAGERDAGEARAFHQQAQRMPATAAAAAVQAAFCDLEGKEEGHGGSLAVTMARYAEEFPMRPARGGQQGIGSEGVHGSAPSGGGNDLADAWREGFDPGVAAAALYRTFGEAVLPYLPGTPLPCVTL